MKTFLSKYVILFVSILFCFESFSQQKVQNAGPPSGNDIQHGIVFYKDGQYGGWPANCGIWIWGNEILVGFVQADYKEAKGIHTYDPSTARIKYARSKDGGVTWKIEDAFENGLTASGADHRIAPDKAKTPVKLTESMPDFTNPDFIFTFLRQNNNNGPSHFYYSTNRGAKWQGPYDFPNLGTTGVASRTDYIVEGKQELSAFVTISKRNHREGNVIYVTTEDGGLNWKLKSWVGPEHGGFDIMPASLRLSPTELITTIRTRTDYGLDKITAYVSNDNGLTWEKLNDPVADTGKGGSPPTLIKLQDGRLALGYIYRSDFGSRVNVRFSSDEGRSWSDEIMLRGGDGTNRDCGYPRMVQRPDGKIVMIYYWNNVNKEGATPYRYIATTIFDPNQWD
jgi:hypothetical protein